LITFTENMQFESHIDFDLSVFSIFILFDSD